MTTRPADDKLKQLGFKKYYKSEPVWAIQMPDPFKCDTKEGDDIRGKAGDYLCMGIDGEVWPIDQSIFKRTYKEAQNKDGNYTE